MFTHKLTIRLHDTDAAGVLFFANQLRIAHEAFEEFLKSAGFSIREIIHGDFYLPVVHAEADFTYPLTVGDDIAVELTADRVGTTSFTILYRFLKNGKAAVGSARTVHVCVDAKKRKKRSLPDDLRTALNAAA